MHFYYKNVINRFYVYGLGNEMTYSICLSVWLTDRQHSAADIHDVKSLSALNTETQEMSRNNPRISSQLTQYELIYPKIRFKSKTSYFLIFFSNIMIFLNPGRGGL